MQQANDIFSEGLWLRMVCQGSNFTIIILDLHFTLFELMKVGLYPTFQAYITKRWMAFLSTSWSRKTMKKMSTQYSSAWWTLHVQHWLQNDQICWPFLATVVLAFSTTKCMSLFRKIQDINGNSHHPAFPIPTPYSPNRFPEISYLWQCVLPPTWSAARALPKPELATSRKQKPRMIGKQKEYRYAQWVNNS